MSDNALLFGSAISGVMWFCTYFLYRHRQALDDVIVNGTIDEAKTAQSFKDKLTPVTKFMFLASPMPIAYVLGLLIAPHAVWFSLFTGGPLIAAVASFAFGLLATFKDGILGPRVGAGSFLILTAVGTLTAVAAALAYAVAIE